MVRRGWTSTWGAPVETLRSGAGDAPPGTTQPLDQLRTILARDGAQSRPPPLVAKRALLFTMDRPLSLIDLGRLERRIAKLVGLPVDLVPDAALRPELRDGALSQAVSM